MVTACDTHFFCGVEPFCPYGPSGVGLSDKGISPTTILLRRLQSREERGGSFVAPL